MSAVLNILIFTACAAAVPVLHEFDFGNLTAEQFDEIMNDPEAAEAYEKYLDCQNDKTKCEPTARNQEGLFRTVYQETMSDEERQLKKEFEDRLRKSNAWAYGPTMSPPEAPISDEERELKKEFENGGRKSIAWAASYPSPIPPENTSSPSQAAISDDERQLKKEFQDRLRQSNAWAYGPTMSPPEAAISDDERQLKKEFQDRLRKSNAWAYAGPVSYGPTMSAPEAAISDDERQLKKEFQDRLRKSNAWAYRPTMSAPEAAKSDDERQLKKEFENGGRKSIAWAVSGEAVPAYPAPITPENTSSLPQAAISDDERQLENEFENGVHKSIAWAVSTIIPPKKLQEHNRFQLPETPQAIFCEWRLVVTTSYPQEVVGQCCVPVVARVQPSVVQGPWFSPEIPIFKDQESPVIIESLHFK